MSPNLQLLANRSTISMKSTTVSGLIALNGTVQSRLMVRRSKSAWVSRIWISERPRVLRRLLLNAVSMRIGAT